MFNRTGDNIASPGETAGEHAAMHREETGYGAVHLLAVLVTSFVVVTAISPAVRWLFSLPFDAHIALSVVAAFACYSLVEMGTRRVAQLLQARSAGSAPRPGSGDTFGDAAD